MMKRFILSAMAAAAVAGAQGAVNSPVNPGYLDRSRLMYTQADYRACLDQLDQLDPSAMTSAQAEEAAWLRGLANYHVLGAGSEHGFRDFLRQYASSLHAPEARLYIGDCLMSRSYEEALDYYLTIDPATLAGHLRDDLTYSMAYCRMKLGDYDQAATGFQRLERTKAYGDAARFYLAYISYAKGQLQQAARMFEGVNTAKAPGNMADYYLSQIYYTEGKYEKTLSTVRRLLKRTDIPAEFTAEANRLAGESLYHLGQTADALAYLERYMAAVDQPALSTLYIVGLDQYRNGEYDRAIKTLQPVAESDDAMGQSALLYIGQGQLRQNNTSAALLTLDRALQMSHDPAVQESAYYNYAVAKYRGGNIPFGSSVATFEEFLRRYPKSRYTPEVQQYIINGWLSDDNYEAALASIERMPNPNSRVNEAKQTVLYVLGSRALQAGKLEQAQGYLNRALQISVADPAIALQSRLLLGETLYRQGDYKAAIKQLDQYLGSTQSSDPNYTVGHYDRGYANLSAGNYAAAAADFEYVSKAKGLTQDILGDALSRLADTKYYRNDYAGAARDYARAAAEDPTKADYPTFQQAVMKGFTRQYADKASLLRDFLNAYPQSSYRQEAMLELAEAEYAQSHYDVTAQAYRQVIEAAPATAQARAAYLRLGSLQLNQGDRPTAIETFKALIAQAPTSDEATLAVDYLKRIGAEDGTLDQVRTFLGTVENAPQIDVAEADRISFVTAEEAYDDGGKTDRLREYLATYPDGAFVAQALGYLFDDANSRDDDDNTLFWAKAIVDRYPDNIRAEGALQAIGDISYAKQQYADAQQAYSRLTESASSSAVLESARLGLMRAYREQQAWADALAAADRVLQSGVIDDDRKIEATYTKAEAMSRTGRADEARKLWAEFADQTDNEFGARSAYALAQSQLDAGDYAAARQTAEALTGSHTPHIYWMARGFIVLSDALRAQGNDYEANSYLEALKKNYPGHEADIFEMIETRL